MSKNRENTNTKLPQSHDHHEDQEQEQEEDNWCFDCKDGGQLVFCDHKNCGKVYHPDCVGKDDSFFDSVKSWVCGRHRCFNCKKRSKFFCLACPNGLCRKCEATLEFALVRGVQGLCSECLEIVQIIELNLDHDSEGKKISFDDRETYECLFKEYWEIVKRREGLIEDDILAALPNYIKGNDFELQRSRSQGEEEKQNDSSGNENYTSLREDITKHEYSENVKVTEGVTGDDVPAAILNNRKGKDFELHTSHNEGEEEKQNDTNSNEDYTSMLTPKKRKHYSSMEFDGWASKPLSRFLASIGRYETEPMMRGDVKSIIYKYIDKKNLYHPKCKLKFFPDDNLFPIFKKKVMSKYQVHPLLESHIAEKLDDSSGMENHNQNKNCSPDNKHIDDQTCMESRLASSIKKPPLNKGDLLIKPDCFASINANNITLIYLRQSLVLELLKQHESFVSKVVGSFVRAKADSNDHKKRNLYHLVRVNGVEHDEKSNGILFQVSFMPRTISISELSDEDFTEEECEDLQQKVNTGLIPKLTVGDLQEKATSLHEDITKHWITKRLVYLQIQIERANLRGRNKEKIALLDERKELEQPWKQQQLLRRVPSVFPELMENKISLGEKETYECISKEYGENVKVREGLTEDDVSASLLNKRKGKDFELRTSRCKDEEEEKQNDTNSNEDYTSMHEPKKQKCHSSMEFVGWASRPLSNFLASIRRYETEPMMPGDVKSLIYEYIEEKNLYHPKDKKKFIPDDKLFPIFKKKAMSKCKINSLLQFHITEKSDDSSGKENHGQNKNCSTDNNHIDDETCMESKLSRLIEKPRLKKGDMCTKPGCFASINCNNITLIYLKRSLVFELSKQSESFVSKVVGTFVRARVDPSDHKLKNSYHLVRVTGVEHDEMSNGILLQVSFMPKVISISELSDEDFTQQECEDLRQKVNSGLIPKLTVVDLQEKATTVHEDITKHWIEKRLVYLQIQIERANLRGKNKEKIALLDERAELQQPWKQEQLLGRVPSVFHEHMEV